MNCIVTFELKQHVILIYKGVQFRFIRKKIILQFI